MERKRDREEVRRDKNRGIMERGRDKGMNGEMEKWIDRRMDGQTKKDIQMVG